MHSYSDLSHKKNILRKRFLKFLAGKKNSFCHPLILYIANNTGIEQAREKLNGMLSQQTTLRRVPNNQGRVPSS